MVKKNLSVDINTPLHEDAQSM